MKQISIGKSGLKTSMVALGTWAIGGGEWWGNSDDSLSVDTIRAAVDKGINLVDTAPVYGFGHSEEVVGRAIKGIRDKVYIQTKCGLVWDNADGSFFFEKEGRNVTRNISEKSIMTEVEASLKRLGTDHIDIYITHWQAVEPFKTPVEETMGALLKLKEQGKILGIGASNVDLQILKEYIKCGQVDLIQEKYSILDRDIEKELLKICNENEITMQAYSPLEMGLLTGKIADGFVPEPGSAREGNKWFSKIPQVNDMLKKWESLKEKYNATYTHLVVAWLGAQAKNLSVLCGARKVEQLADNIGGGNIELSKDDIDFMRASADEVIGK